MEVTQVRRGKLLLLLLLLLLFLAENIVGKSNLFLMILTKKTLNDETIIKNCFIRFRNGDIRPEKTAGMEGTQVRRRCIAPA